MIITKDHQDFIIQLFKDETHFWKSIATSLVTSGKAIITSDQTLTTFIKEGIKTNPIDDNWIELSFDLKAFLKSDIYKMVYKNCLDDLNLQKDGLTNNSKETLDDILIQKELIVEQILLLESFVLLDLEQEILKKIGKNQLDPLEFTSVKDHNLPYAIYSYRNKVYVLKNHNEYSWSNLTEMEQDFIYDLFIKGLWEVNKCLQ